MAFQRPVITDFSAGEVTKKFSGRFDLDLYAKGCESLINWVPFIQGGITTRPAILYLDETYGNVKGRLIPFAVGADVYDVELTPGYLRIWEGDVTVLTTPTYPIATSYTEDEIERIQYCKVSNELYFVSRGHPIMVLTWTGLKNFTFLPLTISCGTGIDAWAASTVYAADDLVTNGTPKRIYKCIWGGTSGATGPLSEESVIVDGGCLWEWSYTKPFSQTGDYPGCIAYFNQRMWYGGTENEPDTIIASMPWDFGNFDYFSLSTYSSVVLMDASYWDDPSTPKTETKTSIQTVVGDDSAILLQFASENDESVMWMVSSDALVVGTATSEWIIPPDVTALTLTAKIRSRIGSAERQAMVMGENPVFLQGTDSKNFLWEYAYLSQSSELDSEDLTWAADQMLVAGATYMDFQQLPQRTIYCVTNGKLACLLYAKKYNVKAWYWLETDGVVQSVSVTPGATDDVVKIIVLRNGHYCVERFEKLWEATIPPLDSYVHVPVATVSTTGLDRLTGETVVVYNVSHGTYRSSTVIAGAVDTTLDLGDDIYIGMHATCYMQSMRLQTLASVTGQTGQGLWKRIAAVVARVLDSFPFKAGYSQTLLLEPTGQNDLGAWTASYSGDVHIPFAGPWTREGYLWIVQDLPKKTTILSLLPEVDG